MADNEMFVGDPRAFAQQKNEELREICRKNNNQLVDYSFEGDERRPRCEFGCHHLPQAPGGLPQQFTAAGWRLLPGRTLRKGQQYRFTISDLEHNLFIIKPFSEDDRGHHVKGRDELVEVFTKFKNDIENSGIDTIFCSAFPRV